MGLRQTGYKIELQQNDNLHYLPPQPNITTQPRGTFNAP